MQIGRTGNEEQPRTLRGGEQGRQPLLRNIEQSSLWDSDHPFWLAEECTLRSLTGQLQEAGHVVTLWLAQLSTLWVKGCLFFFSFFLSLSLFFLNDAKAMGNLVRMISPT